MCLTACLLSPVTQILNTFLFLNTNLTNLSNIMAPHDNSFDSCNLCSFAVVDAILYPPKVSSERVVDDVGTPQR